MRFALPCEVLPELQALQLAEVWKKGAELEYSVYVYTCIYIYHMIHMHGDNSCVHIIHVDIYIHTYIHICIYIYIYIYVYTYTLYSNYAPVFKHHSACNITKGIPNLIKTFLLSLAEVQFILLCTCKKFKVLYCLHCAFGLPADMQPERQSLPSSFP